MSAARDDVDRIIAAWAQERADLDLAPLGVLSRVTRIAKHLDRLRRRVFSVHGLDVSAFDVLATLRRSGEPYQLSPTVLRQQTMVTSGAMTNRIHRLVQRGLVTRTADSDDGRRAVVGLTPEGRGVVDRALADLLQEEQRALRGLGASDRTALSNLLRTLSVEISDADRADD
jgi:DNA-binding MarR family transcriptional regulator